jgi:Ca2+-binding EF-hand superfamily protein
MQRASWLLMLLAFALVSWSLAAAQEGGGQFKQKKGKGPQDEDVKMAKLIEKSYKKTETERDKVIKELTKLAPDEALPAEYNQWFARLAQGNPEWDRTTILRKGLAEIFDRMADRLEITGNTISRKQFVRYAEHFWRPDNSLPWKEAKQIDLAHEAEKMFNHLDRDGNGYLSADEMPDPLRATLRRWDKNGDGVISLDEYRAYFPHRLEWLHREYQKLMEPTPAIEIRPADDAKPRVARAGKLPPGLPPWFEQVDIDGDGQIALFEWRRAGWPVEEFQKLDLNDDGFIVPEELLKLLATTNRDGTRPYAYLLEKQVTNNPKTIPSK